MAELTVLQFVHQLKDSVKEYKKQINDTRSDEDAAYYFDPTLKSFLKKYKFEIEILTSMNFDRGFSVWLKNYLFKEKKDVRV